MIELYNYRRLYPELKEKYEAAKRRIKELEATLEKERRERKAEAETFRLRLEQLETMVFGRKKKPDDDDYPSLPSHTDESSKPPRSNASFRRATPPEEAVTKRTRHILSDCPDCASSLRRRVTVTRFVEDIPLAQKIVEKQTIDRGFCPQCKKTKTPVPVSSQHCTLGPNVRLYVLFAVTVLGQTFEKIKAHLQGLHGLSISDGELAAIIQEGHRKLLPALQDIETTIREAPVAHYDETSWPMQSGEQGNYAWVKTSAIGPETVFRLGRTRGKGNAEELRGPSSLQVGVSDDYGAYRHLFQHHALCWAHPLRKFRELADSGALSEEHHEQCKHFYERFRSFERSIALTVAAPLEKKERAAVAQTFRRKIMTLMQNDELDPPALATLKNTFLEHHEKYLLCIRIEGVPMTNNKAERSLRHLVIKRLLSFGSRTQQGAQAMETILSVCLTLWWRKPRDYFGELRSLMAA